MIKRIKGKGQTKKMVKNEKEKKHDQLFRDVTKCEDMQNWVTK